MDCKTVGIIANATKPAAAELLRRVVKKLTALEREVFLEQSSAALLGEVSDYSVRALFRKCGFVLVLGGDGTLLQAVNEGSFPAPPILGINTGTLGFLSGAGPADFEQVLDEWNAGGALLSERSLLSVEVLRDGQIFWHGRALNEVVVSRGERSRVIRLDVDIDGVMLTEYNADGLIVATPTGSTAYSLSAGGPVLAPNSGVFVVTPICPHVLTNRSVIVNEGSTIEIRSRAGQEGACLTLDGRPPLSVVAGDLIRIRRSKQALRLVFPSGLPFFEVLRQKLKWSGKVV
jgi:NAD+ kinase